MMRVAVAPRPKGPMSRQDVEPYDNAARERVRARRTTMVVLAVFALWIVGSNGFGSASAATIVQVLSTAAIYGIAAVGLNLQYGTTGLLNFGFVAFMTIGAYTTVLLLPHQTGTSNEMSGSWPIVLALLAGMAAAAVGGSLLAIPALRLRADYLAIVMIALGEILRMSLRSAPVEKTGGVFGVLHYAGAFQRYRPAAIDSLAERIGIGGPALWVMTVAWLLLLLVVGLVTLLVRSPWGTVLRSVRDDEDAAQALGTNSNLYKLQSLMLGGALGGLAGGMIAFQYGALSPDIFLPQVTFFLFTIVILGGTGSVWGPVIGSVIFWSLITQTDAVASAYFGGGSVAAALRFVVVGVLMSLLIVFRPQGLLGRREDVILEFK